MRLSEQQHRELAFWGIALIAVGLPLSTILMSVGQFVLLGNWLLEGDHRRRLRQFFAHRLSLVLSSVFFIYVLGTLWAPDPAAAWRDVEVKLPLLLLPLLLFTSKLPEQSRLRQVLYLFVLGTVAGSLVGLANYLGLSATDIVDKRHLSLFTSHIRFGMMTVFSMFILVHFLYEEWKQWSLTERLFTLLVIGWLFYFMVLLESSTAYIIFAVLMGLGLLRSLLRTRHPRLRWAVAVIFLAVLTAGVGYVWSIYRNVTYSIPVSRAMLEWETPNGRTYVHETGIPYTENGHRVWNYICWDELKNEWPKRSAIPFEGLDRSGQELQFTLIRHMTSLGLRKDSVGIHALSDTDVRNIELGHTNHRYTQRWGVSRRIAQVFWELGQYAYNGNPNNSSLIQRWVYTKVGLDIVKENWVMGVGTEGMRHAYKAMYARNDRNLFPEFQFIVHNQFLATTICLGLFGGIWFLIAFIWPLAHYWRNFLYLGFVVMIGISYLSDNTLGSQSGVTLYAFMNALLIVHASQKNIEFP
jgi:hypothetical protein